MVEVEQNHHHLEEVEVGSTVAEVMAVIGSTVVAECSLRAVE